MATLEERYNKLDDLMKMWFRQETLIKIWNSGADQKNKDAREFNRTKKWWQKKKPENFPHYHATPVVMPLVIPFPPTNHKQYKTTKKLIEDYVKQK